VKTVEETWPAVGGRIAGGEFVALWGLETYDETLLCFVCKAEGRGVHLFRAGDLLVEWDAGEYYYLLPCGHSLIDAIPRRRHGYNRRPDPRKERAAPTP
jgi:hypothetical protein